MIALAAICRKLQHCIDLWNTELRCMLCTYIASAASVSGSADVCLLLQIVHKVDSFAVLLEHGPKLCSLQPIGQVFTRNRAVLSRSGKGLPVLGLAMQHPCRT